MDYQSFILEMKEKVQQLLGDDLNVEIVTTLKNNGQERTGLTISESNLNLSPTIYLEEFYEQFLNEYTIDEVAECIAELYEEVRFDHIWPVDIIENFELAKPKLAYRLINANQNQELLSRIPHKTYLDFAIIFYLLLDIDDKSTATVTISNELMHLWQTSTTELYEIAHKNMPQLLPAQFLPMRVVVCEILGNDSTDISEDNPMYVLTNPLRTLGACCILYDDILKGIGEYFEENYYILPGSIHEMLVIPESKSPMKMDLEEMLADVNETQNGVEEVLSDRVYYYDRDLNLLS